jgi:hypothetical protein
LLLNGNSRQLNRDEICPKYVRNRRMPLQAPLQTGGNHMTSDKIRPSTLAAFKLAEACWKQQGALLRSIQKVRADLGLEIERIIGTAEAEE